MAEGRVYPLLAIIGLGCAVVGCSLVATSVPPTIPPEPTIPPLTDTPVPSATPPPTPTPSPIPTPTATATPLPDCASEEIFCVGGIIDPSPDSIYAAVRTGIEQASAAPDVYSLVTEASGDPSIDISQYIVQDYDLVLVASLEGFRTVSQIAQTNPDTNFVVIDAEPVNLPNVAVVTMQVNEASFLAGYLAAGMTKTGVVGTWGGMNIPPVNAFMNGYRCGAAYYNVQNGTNIAVIGTGSYINDFHDQEAGRQITETLLVGGADIIMPVAGEASLVTPDIAAEQNILVIGVDTDWAEVYPETGPVMLTSVIKNMEVATAMVIQAVLQDGFVAGVYPGTLANGSVDLAPYHQLAPRVPEELKAQLVALRQSISDGLVDTCP